VAASDTVLQAAGLTASLWKVVQPRLAAALVALKMEDTFGTVRLSGDDLPGDEEAWYAIVPATTQAPGPVLNLTCHPDAFCRHRPLKSTVYPPQEIWKQVAAPLAEPFLDPAEVSAERTDVFLYHHLLTVADIRGHDLVVADIPSHLTEAFASAWAVAVDGRLNRQHLPGYPMAERRGRFSRLFSAAGIMLPDHWQIFQALWDGGLEGQKAVLGVARQLPRL
jgi:hypothetical protein